MSERWRKPVIPLAIEEDSRLVKIEDGREFRHYEVALRPEDVERIRLGYVCANVPCFEPHESPFPERCSLCGFPMRMLQRLRFEREFVGDTWVGSKISLADEAAQLEEQIERDRHRPGSLILLPRGVSAVA